MAAVSRDVDRTGGNSKIRTGVLDAVIAASGGGQCALVDGVVSGDIRSASASQCAGQRHAVIHTHQARAGGFCRSGVSEGRIRFTVHFSLAAVRHDVDRSSSNSEVDRCHADGVIAVSQRALINAIAVDVLTYCPSQGTAKAIAHH